MSIASNISTLLGVANGENIIAVSGLSNTWEKQTVTLLADYARNAPSDWPDANAGSFVRTDPTAYRQSLPAGTVLTVYSIEAAALIAAGVAT